MQKRIRSVKKRAFFTARKPRKSVNMLYHEQEANKGRRKRAIYLRNKKLTDTDRLIMANAAAKRARKAKLVRLHAIARAQGESRKLQANEGWI